MQSPLANLSSANMNSNVLIIDGELSDLMSSMICDELSHSSHITGIYFADSISTHSLQLILSKIALINNISDVCFAQDYTIEALSLAMNALNSSCSKKTIWANLTDIGRQKVSAHSKNSLVTITDEIWAGQYEKNALRSAACSN